MDLRQLSYLIAVQETGSYAAAAASMNVSPPAVTLSIGKLEKEIGARLFDRGRGGAVPTPAGEVLISRARIARAELNLGTLEIEGIKGARRGNVTIGSGPRFVDHVIPAAIEAFHRRLPKVSVSIITGTSAELFSALRAGDLDFVISSPARSEPPSIDLQQEILFRSRDIVVVRAEHPLANLSEKPSGKDLAKYPWILSVKCDDLRGQVLTLFAETAPERLPAIVRTDDARIIRGLLLNGNYVAVLSPERNILAAGVGRLVRIPVDGIKVERTGAFTTRRRGKISLVAAGFAREVKLVCRQWRKDET